MHIDFYGQPHWLVSHLECSRYFVAALPDLVGFETTLYLESYEAREALRPCLARHRVPADSIEPIASAGSEHPVWAEHLRLSAELIADLELYYAQWYHPLAEHIHGYQSGRTLFWFHDAFTGGDLQISPAISQERVARFCHAVAPRYHLVSPEPHRVA